VNSTVDEDAELDSEIMDLVKEACRLARLGITTPGVDDII